MALNNRVLHVFATLNKGGAESRIIDLYRRIDRTRLQFDFLVLDDKVHYYEDEVKRLGGNIYRINNPKKIGVFKHMLELSRIFRANGPFIAVHSHTSFHSGIVCLIAFFSRIKVRISHARTISTEGNNKVKKVLYYKFGKFLIGRFSTNKLAISKDAGQFLFGNKGFQVVPNAIELERYLIPEKSFLERKALLKIKEWDLVLGHVGRFDAVKNQEWLIDLCFYLNTEKNVDTHLFLVGDGKDKKRIQEKIKEKPHFEKIHFLGLRSDIPDLMKSFDVFVMPSLYEGLGGAVIEAQASGIPIVVSEGIPKEVDLGLGLIERISLKEDLETWSKQILNQKSINKPDNKEIESRFNERKFTIEEAMDNFYKIYEGPV